MIKQRTIKKAVKARGIGIHSGAMVNMTLIPAEIDHGVVFRRLDVGGKLVRAHNAFVNEAILSTSIENQGVKISTVEHLMSVVFYANSVFNHKEFLMCILIFNTC
jgi:UDP-3-O-[3-hydroxymyristoyl] N-acetylglucosamine deacetylase